MRPVLATMITLQVEASWIFLLLKLSSLFIFWSIFCAWKQLFGPNWKAEWAIREEGVARPKIPKIILATIWFLGWHIEVTIRVKLTSQEEVQGSRPHLPTSSANICIVSDVKESYKVNRYYFFNTFSFFFHMIL